MRDQDQILVERVTILLRRMGSYCTDVKVLFVTLVPVVSFFGREEGCGYTRTWSLTVDLVLSDLSEGSKRCGVTEEGSRVTILVFAA